MQNRPPPRSPMFLPRATLLILSGFVLFVLLAMLYSLPVMLEEPPPGASPDYMKERVHAHLDGKITWIMAGAFGIVALVVSRWSKR